jgi:hypothetical protein
MRLKYAMIAAVGSAVSANLGWVSWEMHHAISQPMQVPASTDPD